MGVEVPVYLQDFVVSNPDGGDPKSQGDNHIRNMKTALKNTFPDATHAFNFPRSIASQATTVNLVAADGGKIIPCNAAGGAFTVNLPLGSSLYDGWHVWVVKTDTSANVVTVDGSGAEQINAQATLPLAHQYQSYMLLWCSAISAWVATRSDALSGVDSTLTFAANVLSRAALTGAIQASAGSNATTETIDLLITIGDALNVITTGVKGYVPFDFAATIIQWTLLADVSGSIQLDIWKDTYANYPPTLADTITAAAKPTISGATKNQSSTLSGWNTAIAAGDVLGFNVDSIATIKQAVLALKLTKTS